MKPNALKTDLLRAIKQVLAAAAAAKRARAK